MMYYKAIEKAEERFGFNDYKYAVVEVDNYGGETVFSDTTTMEEAKAFAKQLNQG